MTRRISRRLSFRTVSLAWRTTALYIGIEIAARMAMIVITIINSSRVNPRPAGWPASLPLFILRSIKRSSSRLREHVEHILPAPRIILWVVLIGALSPFRGVRHRILGNTPQELQLLVHLPDHLDALHEDLQLFGITLCIHLDHDESAIRSILIF